MPEARSVSSILYPITKFTSSVRIRGERSFKNQSCDWLKLSSAGEPLKGRSSSLTAIQLEVSGKIDVPKPIILRNEAIL